MCAMSVQIHVCADPMLKEQYALSFWTTSPGPFYNQVITTSIKLLMTLPGKWSILDFKNKIQSINYKTTLVLVCSNTNRSSLSCVCAALKGVYLCRNPDFLRNWPKKKKFKFSITFIFVLFYEPKFYCVAQACLELRATLCLCLRALDYRWKPPSPAPPLLIY